MNILVLCTGNSARSILLEVLLAELGQGKINSFSAGSKPAGQVNPGAMRVLSRNGLYPSNLRSKSWDEFEGDQAPQVDLVITVCDNAANETCPFWPGAPVTVHWGISDPAISGTEAEIDEAFDVAFAKLSIMAKGFIAADLLDKRGQELRDPAQKIRELI